MPYETLRKEVIGLSDDQMTMLIEYAKALRNQTSVLTFDIQLTGMDAVKNRGQRAFGSYAEHISFIAPDFDTCTEGLEEYI